MMQLSKTTFIRFFFILSVCLFPFGNIFRFQISPTISLLPLDCAIFLMVLVSFPECMRNLKTSRLLKGIVAFYGIGLSGLLLNIQTMHPLSLAISALYGFRFLVYCALLWLCTQLRKHEKEIFQKGLLFSGVIMAVFGIFQYLFFPDLRGLYFLGWDEHLFRLFGTLFDPNYSGAVFVITLLLALDRYHAKKSPLWIPLVPLVAIFLTYSRSSFLMLIVAMSAFYVMKGLYRYALIGIVVIVLGIAVIPKNARSEGVDLLRTASVDSRLIEYSQALEIFKRNPFVGVGFNAYRYAQLDRGFVGKQNAVQDHAGAGVPNSFLFLLATTGIAGTTFFIAGIGYFLQKAIRQKNALIVSCVVGLCVHALFENTLFYPFMMFQYMILLGTMGYATSIDTSE